MDTSARPVAARWKVAAHAAGWLLASRLHADGDHRSKNAISAITPQTKGRKNYNFESWSDGGAQTHDVIAPATATTYTARFRS